MPSEMTNEPVQEANGAVPDHVAAFRTRKTSVLERIQSVDLSDPNCNPDAPKIVEFKDISSAAYRIKSGIEVTPCTKSRLSSSLKMNLYFKKEFLHPTGSFKERGARNALLSLTTAQREKGVIAASAGNHALALAYHGDELKIPVTVVMPVVAPMMKVQLCRQYNAKVIVEGANIAECKDLAMRVAQVDDLLYINGYDHPDIIAGAGTMGLEILDQVRDVDTVLIPVGGGGLIAGAAAAIKAMKPDVHIIGVESERCPSFGESMKEGKPVFTKTSSTLADGLAVPLVGCNALATARPHIDKMVTVKEEMIALAILRLIEVEKSVVEGAGATGFAALLDETLLPELQNKNVVVALCGGNIDTTVLGRCLERGLAADGRLVRFVVQVSDRPGGIADLTKLVSSIGVSIKDMFHERAWLKSDIFCVQVKCVVETRDSDHCKELEDLLKTHYSHVAVGPHII